MKNHEGSTSPISLIFGLVDEKNASSGWITVGLENLTGLTRGSPAIFHDSLCHDTSVVHATNDLSCFQVSCKSFIEGSAPHRLEHVKRALLFSKTHMPLDGAIMKYFEDIIFGIHRAPSITLTGRTPQN
jgi:hypothetical protein